MNPEEWIPCSSSIVLFNPLSSTVSSMSRELVEACIGLIWTRVQHPEYTVRIHEQLRSLLDDLNERSVESAQGGESRDSYQTSEAYAVITEKWGCTITIRRLKIAACIVSEASGIPQPSRDAKRKKELLFCWFRDNWSKVSEFFPRVVFESDDEEEDNAQPETVS
jgi:hypothetical protein